MKNTTCQETASFGRRSMKMIFLWSQTSLSASNDFCPRRRSPSVRPSISSSERWFPGIISKSFSSICFKPSMCEYSEMIWFSTSLQNVYPTGGLKMGQVWAFRILTEKVFIQFISNLAGVLVGWVFTNDWIFGPVAKYLFPWWAKNGSNMRFPDINTLRPRQNGRHFADDIFKCIFLNENVWIPIEISLKFVPKSPINNIPALVQKMAWRRPGDKPLSEPMMVSLPTHICVTRPQWVNWKGFQSLHFKPCRCVYWVSVQECVHFRPRGQCFVPLL